MRKFRILYRLIQILVLISFVGVFAFLITALVMREKQDAFHPWFLTACVFLLLAILSLFFLIRFSRSEKCKELSKSIHEKAYAKRKEANRIESYYIDIDNGDLEQTIAKRLESFCSADEMLGKIFFRENKSIYNKKENSSDVFCVMTRSKENTHNDVKEEQNIEVYAEAVSEFLTEKRLASRFINCIFLFLENNISDSAKDFYANFTGLWQSEMACDRFVQNRYFTYCGIDETNNQVMFYQPLRTDDGTEVNLCHLILNELALGRN